MRRILYIAIALAMVAACVGLIIWKKTEGGEKETMQGMTIESKDYKELELEIGGCVLEICEGSEFRLDGENIEKKYLICESGSDRLTIKYKKKDSGIHLSFFGLNFGEKKRTLVLTVPKDYEFENVSMKIGAVDGSINKLTTGKLVLEVGAADLSVEELIAKESAKIKVGAGEIEISKAELNDAQLEIGAGEMTVNGVITGKSSVDCGVGEAEIMLLGNEEDYDGKLDCGLGSLTFGSKHLSVNGSQNISNGKENRLDVNVGIGEVKVLFR